MNENLLNEENYIWQSFDHPGDTYMPGMKLGKNFVTGSETYLTSWRSADDPSPGECTLRFLMVKGKYIQVYIRKSSVIITRIGPYNGIAFAGQPNYKPDPVVLYKLDMVVNQNEMYYMYTSNSTRFWLRMVATPAGKLEVSQLNLRSQEWMQDINFPLDYCDNYGLCGPYGICSTSTNPNCVCLKGFEPRNPQELNPYNGTSGCQRSRTLDCGPEEGFLKFSSMKLPDTQNAVYNGNMNLQECEVACKRNCSCTAYANPDITAGGVGCLQWFGDLVDVRVYPQNGQDLYVRLAASELSGRRDQMQKEKASKRKKRSDAEKTCSKYVSLQGVLEEGQEIAVKRLSKSSRQGLDEFENEVICIAKLQHRNLVKLLGYCIEGDETMLLYELMPNKSLDNELRKSSLDWPQRFHIINGIARGLLYLHQDSRLKVVHRDLKAGNILLDQQMRPKISDFGLARMFKEHESEANTKRVVGTLGYISPEYAVNGLFSVKSDIFSFGVLVLEIVSGKKNRGFVHEKHHDHLLGHAWRLCKEGKSLDLIDECLGNSYSVPEVLRSVHVGLLCVQQRAEDRPCTPSVVAMLGGEGLHSPSSVNGVTLTQIDESHPKLVLIKLKRHLHFSPLSLDTITIFQNITDGETIVSRNERFELGFISPGSSKNRYLGIWYKNTSPHTVIWVANRESPLTNNLGMVKLDSQGIMSLTGGDTVFWSSNTSASGKNVNPTAQLLDSGNMVINDGNGVIWQSFDYPGDTLVSGMKLGKNLLTGREKYLTSWTSADDPSPEWQQDLTLPLDNCDKYGLCGPYGSCSTVAYPNCGCLKGFELKNSEELSPDNWTSGCRRSRPLDCGPGEGFLKFSSMKLPDTQTAVYNRNMSLQDCEVACKTNCSCTAYANPNITPGGVGCLLWFDDLIDTRVYPQNGQDLYVRLAASELLELRSSIHKKKRVVIEVSLSISAGLILLGIILALYIRRKRKGRSDAEREGKAVRVLDKDHNSGKKNGNVELPIFSLSRISKATNNFSVTNKLGEGGFGPVYKGVLEEGQEIAVKRLSKSSRQGLDEFENEVICIAKLQHRNLVKLLGYCIQGEETMLVYEYMPNKSLDWFIFDDLRKSLLDWPQRFHIINGIARGLLYLHQDSRLRVVHRDLKAGNVLLDQDMNPKISDFGLARMFKGHESEANTNRVVGTLGYISPEYAANGLFSIKSDIFSFGVLVLEIVSGKKNGSFAHENHHDNLIGHAWRLYKEGKPLDLIDASLGNLWSVSEVMRSIHVGLLCVQQRAEDRPATPFVVSMLGGESSLPNPKQPGFFIPHSENDSTSTRPSSLNDVTLSQVEGR
ncbi:putative S-locus glycoprotein domain-containing protein [Tanacetum coccineum]